MRVYCFAETNHNRSTAFLVFVRPESQDEWTLRDINATLVFVRPESQDEWTLRDINATLRAMLRFGVQGF